MSTGECGRKTLLALLVLAGCAEQGATQPASQASAPARPPAFKIQTFLPEPAAPVTEGENVPAATERVNDPSAPADTPLCGRAAREANEAAAAMSPEVTASGNACLATACFNPLTSTFIGADGYRHVCQ